MDTRANEAVSARVDRAAADATRRGLGEIVPLIESLGSAVTLLRAADWNDDAYSDTRQDPRNREHLR
jgi:hypothetical protein